MINCTVVYQQGKDYNYEYGAFHIKDVTTLKLASKLNDDKVKMIDHIIRYHTSLLGTNVKIISSNEDIVEFFEKWGVDF